MICFLLGDDCVAINGGSYDINITHVACGPGHGIRFAHHIHLKGFPNLDFWFDF